MHTFGDISSTIPCPWGVENKVKLIPEDEETLNKKLSENIQKQYDEKKTNAKISSHLEGRSSRTIFLPTLHEDLANLAE
jgi:hypothetical protein